MVMDLFWGISLYDVNIDLTDTIKDINELAELNNIGVKWQQTFDFSDKHKNFGFVNLEKEENTDFENGISLLIHDLSKTASSIFTKPSIEYFNKNSIAQQDFSNFYFTKFEDGAKELKLYDDVSKENAKRVSFKYFINDSYDGGEIHFTNFNIKIKPRAGQLLIHPSNYVYSYIENPVNDGTKYQLISWV